MGKPTVYAKVHESLEPMVVSRMKDDKAVRFRSRYSETSISGDMGMFDEAWKGRNRPPHGRWGPRSVGLEVIIPVDVFMEAYPKLQEELSGHGYIGPGVTGDNGGSQARLDSIQVKIHHDDISEPGDSDCYTQGQLDGFGSDWWYMGIVAEATVSYPTGNNGGRRLARFTSGGLWGIESESGEEYVEKVMREEIHDLKKHLEVFGVSSPTFDQLAEKAIEEAL